MFPTDEIHLIFSLLSFHFLFQKDSGCGGKGGGQLQAPHTRARVVHSKQPVAGPDVALKTPDPGTLRLNSFLLCLRMTSSHS